MHPPLSVAAAATNCYTDWQMSMICLPPPQGSGGVEGGGSDRYGRQRASSSATRSAVALAATRASQVLH